MTKSQLLQALGVKAGNKVKKLNGTDYEVTSEDVYPDVRTLVKVQRSLNSSKVIFKLSNKLLDDNGDVLSQSLCNSVPMQRNRVTNVAGYFLSGGASGNIILDDSWSDTYQYDF